MTSGGRGSTCVLQVTSHRSQFWSCVCGQLLLLRWLWASLWAALLHRDHDVWLRGWRIEHPLSPRARSGGTLDDSPSPSQRPCIYGSQGEDKEPCQCHRCESEGYTLCFGGVIPFSSLNGYLIHSKEIHGLTVPHSFFIVDILKSLDHHTALRPTLSKELGPP